MSPSSAYENYYTVVVKTIYILFVLWFIKQII